jgi:Leucine-rich repeat (LRR) protein
MFKARLSLLILVLMSPLTQAATDCAVVTEIPSTECEVLIALYNSTNGDSWKNHNGWNETNTPCSWYGVTCNGGHVSEIRLYNNELGGTIPPELGNLSDLTHLDLSTSWNSPAKLTGTIPTELGNLSDLTSLSLSGNELTGTIPTELGNLSNLTRLYLSSNELTGTIPTELGNLSNLSFLSLGGNELTGTIPTELGNLSNLTKLYLNYNQLTGTIPTELGNLSNLTSLSLDSNELTGSIPTELGNLSNLTSLSLDSNELTGTIPTELGNLSNLTHLYLSNNELTGTIPTELGNLSNLSFLDLSWNSLIGTIPTELGNLSNLTFLRLSSNELTGTIPTELGNLSNLSSLWLDNNDLTGTIPTELGNLSNLTFLRLSSNDLTGTIPTELGNLSNLSSLWLDNNELTGTIPTELGNLSNLSSLSLSGNELTGTIPTELGNLSNLTILYLSSNDLTGTIPTELGNLSNLSYLRLSSNELTGTIPTELGNLSNLTRLFLYNNQLCGEIPTELKNLTKIPLPDDCFYNSCIDIDNNHLTASDSELIEWLDTYNPGWQTTQTPCPQLQFTSATYNVNENEGQATITVTRTGSSDGAVSIDYATSDDTAKAGSDYTDTSGTLDWNDGDDADKTFSVDITDDTQQENDETFIVSLGNPTGSAQLGTPDTAQVTINANDTCTPDTYETDDTSTQARTITSGTTQNHNICPIGDKDWVKFTLNNPSAINLETAGSTGDTRMWLYNNSLQEIEYDDDDGTGAFSKIDRNCGTDELPAGTYYVKVDEFNDDNTIDNYTLSFDATACQFGTVQFSKDTYNINEADGTADITVTRVDGSEGNISVDCNSSDGTAKAGKDYNAIFETLNWSDGNADDKICSVTIINDTTFEDNEIFNLTLENATGGATVGEPATVTIIDDDELQPGTVQFSSDTYSVDENNGTVTLKVSRINGNDGIIFLAYTSTDGSATAGEDYSAVFNTLTWTDGDASDKTFIVPILDDTIFEENETFNLTLTNATGGATIGEPSEAVVTINDNDTPQENHGTLQFSEATYNIDENGGSITIKVNRIDGSDGATSIDYATSDDTATASNDYTAKIDTLNWENGDSTDKTITIDITDDSTPENEETFIVSLANPTGGAQLGKPDTAKVTITDNDQTEKHGTLQFSKDQFTVKENVHTAEAIITVKRIEGSDGAVLVEYTASDDSAKAGSDYTYTKGGLRWEDGDDDDKTFTVPIINDDEPENKETFIVSLANPIGGAQIGSPDTATVTIKDDDKSFNCKKVSGISKNECKALIALYDSTDGENWTYNTGWKATKSPCSWDGVTCRNQHVTGLSLRDNNLSGSIPKDFFKLKKLESLVLSDNNLDGASLDNFKKLKNLEILLIDNCRLSGKIPNSLMKLKKLEELDLNDNCLKTKVSNKLKKWLDELNLGWDETQTDCQ